jgi:acetylornithine/succinyldiaminopimelate/putrescine aminotransferase
MNQRELFFRHVGQTSPAPVGLEVERAEGIYLYDKSGKKYIDLISGVSVSNVGHRHPKVVKAIKDQADRYLHLMVYGEYIQTPQVQLAKKLAEVLPGNIDSVYFVNSGSEAIEGALKLAKRATGRFNIVSCKNAYHGGTHGALSVMGDETMRNAFRPLLPGIRHIEFNNPSQLSAIDETTACFLVEPVQGEGGVVVPDKKYMQLVREKCSQTGTLLIFDEIQTGFGRTGTLFASDWLEVVPDIICLAKGMGGGMPIGAFAAPHEIMNLLTFDPILGHITTFGGHPVSCAAALASLEVILEENLAQRANHKGEIFRVLLVHPAIKKTWGKGLFLAAELIPGIDIFKLIQVAMKHGVMLDPFLFYHNTFRIAPPLTITDFEIRESCHKIISALDDIIAE